MRTSFIPAITLLCLAGCQSSLFQGDATSSSLSSQDTIANTLSAATAPDGQFIAWREHIIDGDDVDGGQAIRGGDGLVMADLDGDGRGDIISVHEDSNHIRIAFAGETAFDWHLTTLGEGPMAGAVEDIAIGDLNGDGWLDVVAACEDAHIIYFENPGDTARTGKWEHMIPAQTTERGSWLRVFIADMDGDGQLDVTGANKGGADIISADAAGRIKSSTSTFLLDGPPLEQASWREQVLLTRGISNTAQPIDIDGDGDMDVLAAARNRQELVLIENLGTQANGTLAINSHNINMTPGFDAPAGWTAASNAFQSDWADFNGDGRIDLVVNVTENSPDSAPMLGLGWLQQPANLGEDWVFHRIGDTLPDWIAGIKLVDVDGDGDEDVVTGGYSGLNILAGAYSGAPRIEDDLAATPSDTFARIAWFENSGDASAAWKRHDISRRIRGMYDAFIAADLDGDGDVDLVSTRGNSGNLDGVFWLEQVRSSVAMPVFSAARDADSKQMPLPPADWREHYRTERTYTPATNTDEH